MLRSKEHYVIDFTFLQIRLTKNKKIIYVLNIFEHFSKFLISFKINNKEGKTISEKLYICYKKYGAPSKLE